MRVKPPHRVTWFCEDPVSSGFYLETTQEWLAYIFWGCGCFEKLGYTKKDVVFLTS